MLRLLTLLVQKNGHFSKTSVMLWIAFGIVAFKYLFAGQTVAGYAVGPFDELEAISFLGIVGGVYVGANAKPQNAPTSAPQALPPPTPAATAPTPLVEASRREDSHHVDGGA